MNPASSAIPAGSPRSVPAASLLFLTLGGVAWLAATVTLIRWPGLVLGERAAPALLALTHLLVLGFLSSLLFGVAYVVGPIMAAAPLWRRGLAWLHLLLHGAGTLWMVLGFLAQNFAEVGLGGLLVFAGLVLFFVNLTVTSSRFSQWEPDHLALHGGLFWLLVTGGLALFIAANKSSPLTTLDPKVLLTAHAHFGFGGFVLLLLVGLALRWIRLQAVPNGRPGALSWLGAIAVNLGLMLVLPALLPTAIVPVQVPQVLLALGTLAFVLDAARLLWSGRRQLDATVGVLGLGLALLLPVMAAATLGLPARFAHLPGLAGNPENWTRFYLLLGLFGPATLVLTGLGGRLTPQLLWQVWRPREGLAPLPAVVGPWVIALSLVLAWIYLGAGLLLAQAEGIRLAALLALFSLVIFLVGLRPSLQRAFAPPA